MYFLSNIRIFIVLDGKSSQGYPINARFRQCSIIGPTIFLLYINDLPDDVIYFIAIYAGDTSLYCECEQASNQWKQLEMTAELEFDLRGTVDWGRKQLVNFNIEKTSSSCFFFINLITLVLLM